MRSRSDQALHSHWGNATSEAAHGDVSQLPRVYTPWREFRTHVFAVSIQGYTDAHTISRTTHSNRGHQQLERRMASWLALLILLIYSSVPTFNGPPSRYAMLIDITMRHLRTNRSARSRVVSIAHAMAWCLSSCASRCPETSNKGKEKHGRLGGVSG
ncbi:hypothetical protein BX600DRAFT_447117 [Xylariales sp. PMI_506]|nr:hypothetical protein BX600DRAFT_447117 [Xylariales sp. PMI_506]